MRLDSSGPIAYSRTALAESVVLNLVKVLTYSSVLLYTLRSNELRLTIRREVHNVRSIRCIFISILKQVFDLRNQQTTGIIKLLKQVRKETLVHESRLSSTWAEFEGGSIFFLSRWTMSKSSSHFGAAQKEDFF